MRQPRSHLLPGDVFVDDIPQALGAGFGRKGQAALVAPWRPSPPVIGRSCPRAGEGSDRLTWSASAQLFSSSRMSSSSGMVGGGKARKAQLVIAGVAAKLAGALADKARGCARGRDGTARPAWQNRQPRTQPRSTSTQARSCTAPTRGTTKFFRRLIVVHIFDDGLA